MLFQNIILPTPFEMNLNKSDKKSMKYENRSNIHFHFN